VQGDRRVALPRGRARSLLGVLALRAGEVVSSDRLIDQLWGQAPPPTATKALHGLVSTLRKRLQPPDDGKTPPVLETRAPGYLLAIDRDQVDANRFRRLVAEATQAPVATKAAWLRHALGLWRGPALDEFAYEPFAQAAIAELEELRLAALEERLEADLALGRHAELVAELEGLVAEHPLRERLRAQLMLALYRCGRQVDALELYRVTRELLVDELGIEPGPALQRLEQAILAQDPSLELPQPDDRTLTAEDVVQPSAGRWLAAGRRTVTVLFADLSGSAGAQATVLADPEAVRLVVMQAYKAAVEVLGRHGATVEGFIGDVVVAVFGVPVAHEDDALRAVRAGLALRGHLAAVNAAAERAHGVRLAGRIGISTGEVVVGDPTSGATSTSGPPVALAARLQQAAGDGEVLLGEPTRRLVGDAAVLEPATRAVADRLGGSGIAWRLVDVLQAGASVRADTPYVGRRDELQRLHGAFDRSVQEGHATLVTVIGEAGVGKSRLAREFATGVEPAARVVTGSCPPYGEGITFWPLREILLELTNSSRLEGLTELLTDDPDPSSTTAQVASAVGMVDQPGDPSMLFGALRRLFEAVARREPLVIIVEDLHWAQPTLLDLLENLAASTRQPLVLLCLARPEFRQRRTSWARELDAAVTVPLEPLDPGESERLLTSRRFGRALPPEAVTRVVETAQGNPLFLEQLLAALRDDLELRIPPTVQALLTARLDRLGPAEQDLLRCASVIGRDFSAAAVTALVAPKAIPFVDPHLKALEAKEFVTPVRGPTPPSTAFRFRHVLIQLAAYASLTHKDRSELHQRFADWLQREAGERVAELEELIGRHLEQAYVHRRDLGLVDATGEALALRAGERLASAGLRAYGRFDLPAAENLLARAKALLPAGHDQRPKVLRRLTEAYPIMGRPEEAEAAFAELLDEVGGDDRLTRGIHLEQTRFRLITGPDQVRLSQAHYILSSVHLRAGRIRELEETARRGLVHAHQSGDLRELLGAPWWIVFALLAGPTTVPACLQACEELIDAGGLEHIGVLAAMGHFNAMLGDFQRARELVAHAQHVLRERLRIPRPRLFVGLRTAGVEVLAGNPEAAERALQPALDVALMVGDRDQASQIAAELSLLLSRRGASDEATRVATLAADQAPAESVTAQALAGAAQARVLLGSGDHREAERFAREAIKPVPDDMLNLRASLLVGLAEILLAAGRHDEAQPVSAEAVQLYERKHNLVAAQSRGKQASS
jgi:DNA-binding SARP family transcriptional activator